MSSISLTYVCECGPLNMPTFLFLLVGVSMGVSGAPPAPPRLYQQHPPAHLQQINSLDYYLDNPEIHGYYQQQQHKGNIEASPSQSARLETLEPDSEVELIPGAQSPQQPPQQTPVAPNVPGLVPGQRVFIVHMPVPGYRPGTIGGYQPVYIVAAAPQGNAGYPGPGNGYQQNTVFLDPSGQVVSPLVGYPRGVQGANPGLVFGAPLVNRPYDLIYQDPNVAYQQVQLQGVEGNRGPVRLAQLVTLQGQQPAPGNPRPVANENASAEQKQSQSIVESKENNEERRNARPAPPHAVRNKA